MSGTLQKRCKPLYYILNHIMQSFNSYDDNCYEAGKKRLLKAYNLQGFIKKKAESIEVMHLKNCNMRQEKYKRRLEKNSSFPPPPPPPPSPPPPIPPTKQPPHKQPKNKKKYGFRKT